MSFCLSAKQSVQSAIFLEGLHPALETEMNIKPCPLESSTFGTKKWYPAKTILKTYAKSSANQGKKNVDTPWTWIASKLVHLR